MAALFEPVRDLPTIRRPHINLEAVPRDWYGGSPEITCFVNALHLFIPAGETFFVRTVNAASRTIPDPLLKGQVARFVGQEIIHGQLHRSYQRMQIDQGQEISSWLCWYEQLAYGRMEARRPLVLNLSITVALEHLISSLGEWILKPGHSLAQVADPEMAALFHWHAAEEIEHKAIAFDVYQAFSGNLFIRWLGLVIALGEMLSFWLSASWHLARQDSRIKASTLVHGFAKFPDFLSIIPCLLRATWLYMWPGFHPNKINNDALAAEFLREFDPMMTGGG
jgi:uncharacterized protein